LKKQTLFGINNMAKKESVIYAELKELKAELARQASLIHELKLSRTQKMIRSLRRRKRALFIIFAIATIIPAALYALNITKSFTFTAGNPTVASEVNANFDQLFTKVNDLAAFHPPIGTILAWHKSEGSTPGLPASGEWVECNGQTLNDLASPYHTHVIVNLNGDLAGINSPGQSAKIAMFLRGGLTSGTGQQDAFQGHLHTVGPVPGAYDAVVSGGSNAWSSTTSLNTSAPISDGTNGTPRTAGETRPVNMSVVWIMKVK
jgi:hypothetical protein